MLYIHENGWLLFVVSEGLTWVLVFFFLLSRYWLRFDRLSQMWLFFIVGINIFQILLGGIDFYFTGEISFFQIVIVLFITYACTLGSSDFARLDRFIKRKFDRRSKRHNRSDTQVELKEELTYRCLLLLLHTSAFGVMHMIWFVIDRFHYENFTDFTYSIIGSWFGPINYDLLASPLYFMLSYTWSIVLLFDLMIVFGYIASVSLANGCKRAL
ncbi:hypothetical protein [Halalkalibacter okhensis]|uniref:Integral membrane protein n=1 Tax=Halalkalibacter okhensis TaxID=333138 RepID=A0A0B0IH28_9BACI|nr:hypothetical protein [Halalkalibacter okhensis]KHF40192.1 hypothetical protein LQ50_10620 [Halalkalibacter okhensis]